MTEPSIRWRIELFGELRVVGPDRVIERFPTRKCAALLAYLALFPGRSHPRDVLAGLLWPEAPAETARHNLRLTLSRLRALFGSAPPFEADRHYVRLDRDQVTTDVMAFESAVAQRDVARAHALYQGALLPGIYEDAIQSERRRLERLWELIERDPTELAPVPTPAPSVALPVQLTRFIGRRAEIETLCGWLSESRLVTLSGPGGAGKTRLAIEVARRVRTLGYVSVAELRTTALLWEAIRRSLCLPSPAPEFRLQEYLFQELSALGPGVLVLDNAETLLAADDFRAGLVALLYRVPHLTLLVTSRRALQIPGERLFPVRPLARDEAIALFWNRALLVRPDLDAESERESVAAICQRLDQMPLAVELMASHAELLSPRQIRESLEQLAGSTIATGAVGAFQTSLDLLTPSLRRAFQALSLFDDGFTQEAAQAVADLDGAGLGELQRASLLERDDHAGLVRWRMLQPLRDFCREQLHPDAVLEIERRHAHYRCLWAEENRVDRSGTAPEPGDGQLQRLAIQAREQANVRAVLRFCIASTDPTMLALGLRLYYAYWTFWYGANLGTEMESWGRQLLEQAEGVADPALCARARIALGLAYREQGKIVQFRETIEEAIPILLSGVSDRHCAHALHLRGLGCTDVGDWEGAEVAYQAAEACWLAIGDNRNAATTRHNRALLAQQRGQLDEAEVLCADVLRTFREWNETVWVAMALSTWASIQICRAEWQAVLIALEEALEHYAPLGYARGEAEAHRVRSECYRHLQLFDAARQSAHAALSRFRRVGDRRGEAEALLTLAAALEGCGTPADHARARLLIAEARALHRSFRWPTVGAVLAVLDRGGSESVS